MYTELEHKSQTNIDEKSNNQLQLCVPLFPGFQTYMHSGLAKMPQEIIIMATDPEQGA